MSVVILDRSAPRLVRTSPVFAYVALSRRLAAAAGRGDDVLVRRLLAARERLLATMSQATSAPSRTVLSEVRALEAQTMVALGAPPVPVGQAGARMSAG